MDVRQRSGYGPSRSAWDRAIVVVAAGGRVLAALAFTAGMALLALNFYGLAMPPHLDPRLLPLTRADDRSWTVAETYPRAEETDENYVRRMCELVHRCMVNAPYDDIVPNGYMRVRLADNWLLRNREHHETMHWRYGLKRGVGLCSQQAMVVASLLQERGYECGLFDFEGHVVAWVELEGEKLFVDPDYGLCYPHRQLQNDSQSVLQLYLDKAGANPSLRDILHRVVLSEDDNRFIELRPPTRLWRRKWTVPLTLTAIGGLGVVLLRRRRERKAERGERIRGH